MVKKVKEKKTRQKRIRIKKIMAVFSSFAFIICSASGFYLLRKHKEIERTDLKYSEQVNKNEMTFFAHRGYSDFYPEESYSAERAAALNGFDGLNIDLWPTKKDENGDFDFTVSHSDKLNVISDRNGLITDLTAEQAKQIKLTHGNGLKRNGHEHVRLLGDMINLANKYEIPMQLEMKGKWTDEQMDALYRRIQKFKKKVYIECIYRQPLTYMASRIKIENQQNRFETNYVCYGRKQDIDYCHDNGINRIAISDISISQSNFNYAIERNVDVSVFSPVGTQNTKRIAYKLKKIGVKTYTVADKAWKSNIISYLLLYRRYR